MTPLQTRLVAHILDGGSPKEFAIENKMHLTAPGKILTTLGIGKMFVTEAERREIMKIRKTLKQ